MRILVTGKDGQVGGELSRLRSASAEWFFLGRQECDLADPEAIRRVMRELKPGVVVNAGAHTAVDRAESEPEICYAVNAVAPGIFAEEAARTKTLLIHFSTEYVFDGQKQKPYEERDPIAPLNIYGASKAAGERAIEKTGCRHLILRTSWVYHSAGKNFLCTMLRLAAERKELRVVDDVRGAPTSAGSLAAATLRLVDHYVSSPEGPFPFGVYHLTAGGATSWCGFAREIVALAVPEPKPQVIPISSAEYPTAARRPVNSLLANTRFERAFGFRLPPWTEQLRTVLGEGAPALIPADRKFL